MSSSFIDTVVSLLTNPKHTRWLAPCLVLTEVVLCGLIVWKVPYTEIDWETYMIQVRTFLPPPELEFDYSKLAGPTGPLVYPALHLYLHTALYYITGEGENIQLAQYIYAGIYMITIALVLACYRRAGAPPWLLVPLVLSKRLHSIFLLRLFNDCWVTLFFWLCVYAAQRRYWIGSAVAWTFGLGIKMTMLLALPGLVAVLVQGAGMEWTVFAMTIAWMIQFGSALPFLGFKVHGFVYLSRAFNFGRQFLYKWTVNWRFVDEKIFSSKEFAIGLLVLHVVILLAFWHYRWTKPSSPNGLLQFCQKYVNYMTMKEQEEEDIAKKITPTFVMDTLLGSMVIGMLCARSLHYQFYAYLGWITPYLLWRMGVSHMFVLINWAGQEYAWLVYPSTNLSSAMVVSVLALQVLCALMAPPVDHISPPSAVSSQQKKKQ